MWTIVNDLAQLVAATFASVAAACSARRAADGAGWAWERRARVAMSLGSLAWAAGQAVWTWYEVVLRTDVPSPGVVDLGFISAPIFWIVGLLMLVDTPAGLRSQVSGVAEGLMTVGGLFLPAWTWFLGPVVRDSDGSIPTRLLNLAPPVQDVFVLATVLFVLTRRHRMSRGSLPLVAFGMVAIAFADCSFWYLTTTVGYEASAFDAGWIVGFVVLGIGVARRRRRIVVDTACDGIRGSVVHRSWKRLAGPDVVAAAGLGTTLVLIGTGDAVFGPFEQATALALVAVSFVHRMAGLVENHSLTAGLEARVQRRTADLEASERYFEALVRSSTDIITVVDADRTIRSVSASIADIFGWSHELFIGQPFVATPPFGPLVAAVDAATVEPERVHRVEWRLIDSHGMRRSAESTVSNLLADGDIGCFVINTRDVTDRAELERQLRHQAFHDPLTGLPNRALFADRVEHALRRCSRTGTRVGIAMIDLDGFKGVNDSHGHEAGDDVLRAVADQLGARLQPTETVARLGGDEFAVLVEDLDDGADPGAVARRIAQALRFTFVVAGTPYEVSASVGMAVSDGIAADPTSLLRDADIAMYSAKRDGRGVARIFEPDMHAEVQRRFALQAELRDAVQRDEMVVHYQPTFSLRTGRLEGFEALVRWEHPDAGLLPPGRFVPLAEECGLIVPIGDWVLRTAVRQLADWSREFRDGGALSVAVNVSVSQLRSPGLAATLREVLDDAGVDPRRLVVEITESMLISDGDAVLDVLDDISATGVRLAIDDFGTGYASLANLKLLPLDILKIDRTFVSGEGSRDGVSLVHTILDIARTLGLETVGEGIEDAEQLELLRQAGCDVGQGYHLGKPMPATAARELLVDQAAQDRAGRASGAPLGSNA